MRSTFRGFLAGFAIGSFLLAVTAHAADSPHYEFKNKFAVYEVIVRTEIPGAIVTYTGHIAYGLKSVGPEGQLDLLFKSHFDSTKEAAGESRELPAGFEGNVVIEKPDRPLAEVTLDRFGGGGPTQGLGEVQALPKMLGPEWRLPLVILSPTGASTWATNSVAKVHINEGGTLVLHEMSVPTNFETTAGASGRITIKGHQDWSSPDQVQGKPLLQEKGELTTVFDIDAGVVAFTHRELTQTMASGDGKLTTITATVDAHLLKGPEADAFSTEIRNGLAKYEEHLRKMQARDALENADAVSTLPAGMAQTQMIGLNGGGPYIRIDHAHRPMIGMAIRLGKWNGHTTLTHVQPVYAVPGDLQLEDTEFCLAKEGYVVGGIVVSKIDSADGLQLIFVKSTPKGLDPQETYRSQWFGDDGGEHTQIAGNGEKVVGTFGRQGLNNDKLGLVLDVRNDPMAAEAVRLGRLREAAEHDGLDKGIMETELVGPDGPGNYVRIDPDHRPLIGFKIKLSNWGHVILGDVQPLFEPPADKPADKNEILCVARPGYVVGGVTVHKDTYSDGLRVTFMKLDGDRIDPKQAYTSPWYGFTGKGKAFPLLGTGEKILGTVGRQGMNNDALGLVYEEKPATGSGAAPK